MFFFSFLAAGCCRKIKRLLEKLLCPTRGLQLPTPAHTQCHMAGGKASVGVVVSVLASINVVNRHWARLLLGWVTAWVCNQYVTSHLGRLSLLPSVGW